MPRSSSRQLECQFLLSQMLARILSSQHPRFHNLLGQVSCRGHSASNLALHCSHRSALTLSQLRSAASHDLGHPNALSFSIEFGNLIHRQRYPRLQPLLMRDLLELARKVYPIHSLHLL